jgi:hypothetical protein
MPARQGRKPAVPAKSRVTARRTVAALRRGREALAGIEAELDDLLARLRNPDSSIDCAAPERLRKATEEAGDAMAALSGFGG